MDASRIRLTCPVVGTITSGPLPHDAHAARARSASKRACSSARAVLELADRRYAAFLTSDVTFFCYGFVMRADRLLSILLLLQGGGRMTARTLAQRLECSERTILRDMDALSGAGVPVIAERGVGGGWRLLDGYQTKLTGLTAVEIQSLFLARPPKLMADLGLKQAADAAWLKLQAALPMRCARRPNSYASESSSTRAAGETRARDHDLPLLLEALWRGRRLRFEYAPSGDAASERIVEPLGLVARGSVWYLVADRDDQRRTLPSLRSRIANAEVLAAPSRTSAVSTCRCALGASRDRISRQVAAFLRDAAGLARGVAASPLLQPTLRRRRITAIKCYFECASTPKRKRCNSRSRSARRSWCSSRRRCVRACSRRPNRSCAATGRTSLRRLDLRHQRERPALEVGEERHPLLRAVSVPVEHVRTPSNSTPPESSSPCFAAMSATRK